MDENASIARKLAEYAAAARPEDLPEAVWRESRRAFLNILGCMIGGSRHETVSVMKSAFAPYFGPAEATLIGQRQKADILHASYINCLSSSVDSFDDNHAEMIVHPAGPAASVVLALAEKRPVSGRHALHAFALGMEVMCRLCKSVSVAPARANLAWVQTSIVGGMGAAVAAGKMLGLDSQKLVWAIGIAGSQAAGYRANHGTMCTPLMPAQTARSGLEAALLAERGFTGSEASIEGKYGFCTVFSEAPNVGAIVEGLGSSYELLGLTYKPFPSGVVLNPVIEACLTLANKGAIEPAGVKKIRVTAHPTAVAITNRKHPTDAMAAQLSLQHWAAVAIACRKASTAELSIDRISDPVIARLRDLVEVEADAQLSPDAAKATVVLRNERTITTEVETCVGSGQRPMSDQELEDKFRHQAEGKIGPAAAIEALLRLCRDIDKLDDLQPIIDAAA